MLKLATFMIIFISFQGNAGVRFKHLIYVCSNEQDLEFHILAPNEEDTDLNGQLMAYNKKTNTSSKYGAWCAGTVNWKGSRFHIKEEELLGHKPSACSFTLNTETLSATYDYKMWDGYVGGLSKPIIKVKEKLKCEEKDEIVEY